jgi:hypothetical protein
LSELLTSYQMLAIIREEPPIDPEPPQDDGSAWMRPIYVTSETMTAVPFREDDPTFVRVGGATKELRKPCRFAYIGGKLFNNSKGS